MRINVRQVYVEHDPTVERADPRFSEGLISYPGASGQNFS
jgi:hypothetical protein